MDKPNIVEQLGINRAISIDLDSSNLSESQLLTIKKVQDFDIGSIYFCTIQIVEKRERERIMNIYRGWRSDKR